MKTLTMIAIITCFTSTVFAQTGSTQEKTDLNPSKATQSKHPIENEADGKGSTQFAERMKSYQAVAELVRAAAENKSTQQIKKDLKSAIAALPNDSFLAHQLQQAITKSKSEKPDDAVETTNRLTGRLTAIAEDLAFMPTLEADFPAGFGSPTPVGEIEVKAYPAYRMVQTDVDEQAKGNRGASAFFRLFNHIQSNEIAMTSPVEMTYTKSDSGLQEKSMAFLYQNQAIGKIDEKDQVKVMDVEPVHVIAMGLRGDVDDQRVFAALEKLKTRATEIAKDFELTDEIRVMGYNGPSVAKKDRFYEVQIELKPTKKSSGK